MTLRNAKRYKSCELNGRLYGIVCSVGCAKFKALVDSGAQLTALSVKAFKRLGNWREFKKDHAYRSVGSAGVTFNTIGRLFLLVRFRVHGTSHGKKHQ